jgi:hypothetical protein
VKRRLGAGVVALSLIAAGCGLVSTTSPPATPADFPGIVLELGARGVFAEGIVAGDAGCDDPALVPTAIGFRAHGLDQAEPVQLHVYIFRNQDAYARLRSSVDACTLAYPDADGPPRALDAAPFVIAGSGDWGPAFSEAIRNALIEAAGAG